jgi:hypothetical protein
MRHLGRGELLLGLVPWRLGKYDARASHSPSEV